MSRDWGLDGDGGSGAGMACGGLETFVLREASASAVFQKQTISTPADPGACPEQLALSQGLYSGIFPKVCVSPHSSGL